MSSTSLTTDYSSPAENRRSCARRKLDRLAYVACGPDNGGILLDVGEGGLSFQGVGTVHQDQQLQIRFVLPGTATTIETNGQLVWSNEAKKGGGLRFDSLNDAAREEIKRWVAGSNSPAASKAVQGVHAAPPAGEMQDILRNDAPAIAAATAGAALQDSKPSMARTPYSEGMRRLRADEPRPKNSQPIVARKEAPAEPQPGVRVVLTGIPERSSRVASYVWGAACICAVLLAAMIGVQLHGGITGVLAGRLAALSSEQPASSAAHDFQVEVVDANNRRWVLSNSDQTHASDSHSVPPGVAAPPRANPQSPAVAASAPRAAAIPTIAAATAPVVTATTPSAPTNAVTSTVTNTATNKDRQQLALQVPHVLKPQQPAADRQEPAITDNLSPLAVSVDPGLVAAGPANPPRPAQPPAPPAASVRPSGLQNAVLIKRVEPIYPPAALTARIEGTIEVKAAIDRDGIPHELRLVSGDPRLAKSAMDAIRQWRYKPAILDGEPTEGEVIVDLEFRLRKS